MLCTVNLETPSMEHIDRYQLDLSFKNPIYYSALETRELRKLLDRFSRVTKLSTHIDKSSYRVL